MKCFRWFKPSSNLQYCPPVRVYLKRSDDFRKILDAESKVHSGKTFQIYLCEVRAIWEYLNGNLEIGRIGISCNPWKTPEFLENSLQILYKRDNVTKNHTSLTSSAKEIIDNVWGSRYFWKIWAQIFRFLQVQVKSGYKWKKSYRWSRFCRITYCNR